MRAKRWFRLMGCGFGLLGLMALATAAEADVFQDGQFHELSGTYDHVTVRNTTDFWTNEPTYVEILSGANVGNSNVYDTSQLTVSGGSIGRYLEALNSSQVAVSGGRIDDYLYAYDSSQVTVSGGSIGGLLRADDSSQVTVSGGSFDDNVYARNDSQVTISGGSIRNSLIAYGSSNVTVSGGTMGAMKIGSTLTVLGSDFIIDGRPVGFGEYDTGGRGSVYGTLSGTFPGGETFTNNFEIHGDGKLILTPEPATLALLAAGGLGLLARRRPWAS